MNRRSVRGAYGENNTKNRQRVGAEDMTLLEEISDKAIMENLKVRLESGEIYTYIGNVLICCNPYKWLDIYSAATLKRYIHQMRTDVPPHIFALSEAAYRGMVLEEENQCLIISGESGAGKTEASKQIQNYIAGVSGGGEGVDELKEIFLKSNPVLEAFGNAKTLRNNNSSRFGKYFELKFNKYGSPRGGKITNYLLEKSRVVCPGPGERGYHIFYQLILSGYDASFALGSPSEFNYLNVSGCETVDGINDVKEFEDTISAMNTVGMSDDMVSSVMSLVAAILHLGNMTFTTVMEDGAEGSQITGEMGLQNFATLTGVDAAQLGYVITHREMVTMAPGGKTETYQVPQSATQATSRRDAIAKTIYERIFDMIVERVNVMLDPNNNTLDLEEIQLMSIGVLDIYGFEIFQNNGFEQLCINYVNEKLQQIFIELTLRAEQEEYDREGIQWEPIPFFNNKVVCELLDGAKPPGLFRVLDDTTKTNHGAKTAMDIDRKFGDNLSQNFASHAHFANSSKFFTIKHYAGNVDYTYGKFGEANKDALANELVLALQTSPHDLMQVLFSEVVDTNNKKAPPSSGNRIRVQCNALVTALMECQPHYVRCVKSNDDKKALTINDKRVTHQAKYLGLAENIKVRRAGFAFRTEYHRFLDRMNIISPKTYPQWFGEDAAGCKEIINYAIPAIPELATEVQWGRTMIFIRRPETYFAVEKYREKRMGDYAARIQKLWRKYFAKKDFVSLQSTMSQIYSNMMKQRRRQSIFRPYSADYLDNQGDLTASIREGMFRIIDHYDSQENVIFADAECYQAIRTKEAPFWDYHKHILVLTTRAIYLVDRVTDAEKEALQNKDPKYRKEFPDVFLRRRISLKPEPSRTGAGAVLDSLSITKLADPLMVLHTQPVPFMEKPVDNKLKEDVCSLSGKKFNMFTFRHHCRACGHCFIYELCNTPQAVPDLGVYNDAKVCNTHIGLQSTQQSEDMLFYFEKKTEFIGLLTNQWVAMHGPNKPLVAYSNNINIRAGPNAETSLAPATTVSVNEYAYGFNGYNACPYPNAPDLRTRLETDEYKAELQGNQLTVWVAPGVPEDFMYARQRRQAERAEKRKIEDEQRRVYNIAREEERKAARLAALEEKKRQKKAAKAGKGGAAPPPPAAPPKAASPFGARKAGGAPPPPPPGAGGRGPPPPMPSGAPRPPMPPMPGGAPRPPMPPMPGAAARPPMPPMPGAAPRPPMPPKPPMPGAGMPRPPAPPMPGGSMPRPPSPMMGGAMPRPPRPPMPRPPF
jgi:myosin-1